MKLKSKGINSRNAVSPWQYVFLILYFCISLFPLYWIFITSLKSSSAVLDLPVHWIPQHFQFSNFVDVFRDRPFAQYTLNSIIASLGSTIIVVLMGTPAAYSFSKFKFRGNKLMFFAVLVSRMIPPIALIVPFYAMMQKMGLIDTRIALVITYTFFNLPFVIWIMKSYFDEIPGSLDEAAKIDGASKIQTLTQVILPTTLPGIAASAMLAFIFAWNEFVFTLVLTLGPHAKTIPVGMMDFIQDDFTDWAHLMTGGVIAAIPAILFGLFFQKYIVTGLAKGAVKE